MSTKNSSSLFLCATTPPLQYSIIPFLKCHGLVTRVARVENLQTLDNIDLSRRHDLEHPRRGVRGRRAQNHQSPITNPSNPLPGATRRFPPFSTFFRVFPLHRSMNACGRTQPHSTGAIRS